MNPRPEIPLANLLPGFGGEGYYDGGTKLDANMPTITQALSHGADFPEKTYAINVEGVTYRCITNNIERLTAGRNPVQRIYWNLYGVDLVVCVERRFAARRDGRVRVNISAFRPLRGSEKRGAGRI